jgi:hypothetical protein
MSRYARCLVAASVLHLAGFGIAVGQSQGGASGMPVVTVLDPGNQPRRELRYDFAEGNTEQLVLQTTGRVVVSMEGQQLPATESPPLRFVMDIAVADVRDDGSARIEFETTSVDVSGDGGATAAAMGLDALQGLSGWSLVDTRGYTRDGGIGLSNASDQLAQVTDNLEQSLQQLSVPLPAEPVGEGAQWRVVGQVRSGALSLSQTALYTLASIDGDELELIATLEQSATPQRIEVPGMPAGAAVATLESLEGKGDSTIRLDLRRVVPRSTLGMDIDMTIGIAAQGQTQRLSMNVSNDLTIDRLESR